MQSRRFSQQEASEAIYADERNFYKVEKWTADEEHVDVLLFAGSDLDEARNIFAWIIDKRPRAHLTIRQRSRVVDKWPK
jgi:hypothetical protein